MAQFKAFSPEVEVNGQTVLSIVAGMGFFKSIARSILSNNGISDPIPNQWYSQQAWLDSFREIAAKAGPTTLENIGRSIPENADWPPEIVSVGAALASIDVAYHMNHRGGEIGHYELTQCSDDQATVVCNNPYPCSFDQGIIKGVIEKFGGEVVLVTHQGQACRNAGNDACNYIVEWKS